jgi:hypothetical protein
LDAVVARAGARSNARARRMASPRRRTSAAVCGVDANHVDDACERDGVARR